MTKKKNKVVVMLRYNSVPEYDSRMALQKKSLEDAGYDVYQMFIEYSDNPRILCLHDNETISFDEEKKVYRKVLYYLTIHKAFTPLKQYLMKHLIYELISKHVPKIDIVHAHNLNTMPLALKLKSKYKCKIIYDMREMFAHMAGGSVSKVVTNWYLNKDKELMKKADWIFIMEELTRKWVRKMNKTTPISLVMNSRPLMYKKYDDCKKTTEPLKMLFLGTISESRYISEAIDVVEKMDGRVKFYIGGCEHPEPYYYNVLKKCKEAKHSDFVGVVHYSSIVPIMRQCDVIFAMANPSQLNNGPAAANKQLEAMIAGRPVVTSIGTYSGKITADNKCGLIIEHCKAGLRIGLEYLLQEPKLRIKYGKNALKAAKKQYNWGADSKRMLAAYKELLK